MARRTRAWHGGGSDTVVQFRNDCEPGQAKVYIHTGLGWIPASNSIGLSDEEAEKMAEETAKSWKLIEVGEQLASWLAGWDEEDS